MRFQEYGRVLGRDHRLVISKRLRMLAFESIDLPSSVLILFRTFLSSSPLHT